MSPGGIGAALVAIALGIVLWQGRARRCSRHHRWAGRLAWMLAALAFAAGVWLLSAG